MLSELRKEIHSTVQCYCQEAVHRDTAIRVLCREGFALHPDSSCRAGMFTLEVYRAITGDLGPNVLSGAAGVELVMESGFLFDNVADEEEDPNHELTAPEELALAITLLSCGIAAAQEAANRAGHTGLASQSVLSMHANCISACGGQFLDAYLQKAQHASTDESLKMTYLKSGSLGRLAAEFGASLATSNQALVEALSDFGFNLFTYLQLVDDIRDALPSEGPAADLVQHKKTLPLVYFYNTMGAPLAWPEPMADCRISPELNADLRRRFDDSGSGSFCAIVAETYLNRAKSDLAKVRPKLATVERLELLVRSLEISPQEVLVAT